MRISVSLAVAATVFAFGASRARAAAASSPYEAPEAGRADGADSAGADPGAGADRPVQRLSGAAGLRLSAARRRPACDAVAAVVSARLLPVPGGRTGPVYYAPPPVAVAAAPAAAGLRLRYRLDAAPVREEAVWDGARRFSLGAHAGFLTLNQTVGNDRSRSAAPLQLRLRSAGRWGFEASQSFFHGSYWSGAWQRDAFPFSLSLMFYIFPNEVARHFNLYGVAGIGLVADSVTLNDENRRQVTQVHRGRGPRRPRRRAALQVVRDRGGRALHQLVA